MLSTFEALNSEDQLGFKAEYERRLGHLPPAGTAADGEDRQRNWLR